MTTVAGETSERRAYEGTLAEAATTTADLDAQVAYAGTLEEELA